MIKSKSEKKKILLKLYAPKQLEVLARVWSKDFFICGLHGAKRSGKTIVNNDIFLSEISRAKKVAESQGVKEPIYILAGTSSKAIQNNILQELYNRYGFEPKFDKHGSFMYKGVKIVQVYTGTIAGLGAARGFEAYGAYINEASLANEIVFKEIISRCSGKGARVIWDSNPDNPSHWLKKDYIDSADGDRIIHFHFKLDDNEFLDERYVESIKASTPSGRFYERDILGLWSVAEGAVYPDFDKDIHIVKKPPENVKRYFAGVDWGYNHYGALVIIAETEDDEYYIVDGVAKQGQEIDYWVKEAKKLEAKYGRMVWWCDSARTEHIARFKREGLNAKMADKAVIPGIEYVATLWKTKRLFYVEGSIPRFEEEIYQYQWEDSPSEDKPKQEFDDVMDATRYPLYSEARRKGGGVRVWK